MSDQVAEQSPQSRLETMLGDSIESDVKPPELPLEPEVPLVPDEPEVPDVPDEPLVPEVPEVPAAYNHIPS